MKECLKSYFSNEEKHGLLIAEVPTGYGKTYQTVQAIYEHIHSKAFQSKGGKVIFTTPLLKNLPENEFQKVYATHGRSKDFSKEVLVLPSNLDGVIKALASRSCKQPPFAVQEWKEYQCLKTTINSYNNAKSTPAIYQSNPEYVSDLESKLRQEIEPAFRKRIEKLLKKDFPIGKAERQNAIRHDKNYQWIADFYPASLIDEYKVIMMSVSKLLFRNSTIAEPSYPFLSERFLKNSIVCIDEFDATKADILKRILEQAYRSGDDYIQLFKQVRNALKEHRCSKELMDSARHYESKNYHHLSLDSLQKEAEEIYQNYHLEYSFKTAGKTSEYKKNFLFHDDSYHSVFQDSKTHIRAVADHSLQKNLIYLEDRNVYRKNRKASDLILQNLLRRVSSFLRHFQIFIRGWSEYHAISVNSRRNQLAQGEFTPESALSTICHEFGLSPAHQKLLSSELCISSSHQKKHSLFAPDLSVYEQGFRLFELTDRDEHESITKLQYIQVQNTPEKILLYLCQQAKVVGLSATADLETVIGNYDLSYLKEQLGNYFHTLDAETNSKIQSELQHRWKLYQDGTIHVKTKIVDAGLKQTSLRDWLSSKLSTPISIRLANKIESLCDGNSYNAERYCCILNVMSTFWKETEIQSLLCLSKILPAPNKPAMDIDLLTEAFQLIKETQGKGQRGELFVLKSGYNFEQQKQELIKRLSTGEKLFILSSYQTLGAGQNLQYSVQNPSDYIQLDKAQGKGDKRTTQKDIDALYLGDITHNVVNLGDDLTTKDILNFCFQAECLYQNNEISASELNQLIKAGLMRYAGQTARYSYRRMGETLSARRVLTRDVIQAIGRINRTFLKKNHIWIMTTQSVLTQLDPTCLQNRFLCPEMQALLNEHIKWYGKFPAQAPSDDNHRLNRAEQISSRGKSYIFRMLGKPWTEESMVLWNELRETVLKYPRATEEQRANNPIIASFYIPVPPSQQSYCYAQKGDFASVYIDLNDETISKRYPYSDEYLSPREVSEQEARLQEILSYAGIREHFEQMGYATEFGVGEYMLSPVLFQNIYKGALGEVAGRYLLEHEFGLSLSEITDPEHFELFDYHAQDRSYIDFKHWKAGIELDGEAHRRKVLDKLECANGEKAYIINLLKANNSKVGVFADGRIVELPWLIDQAGHFNGDAIAYLEDLR